jgi:hypothetical protein
MSLQNSVVPPVEAREAFGEFLQSLSSTDAQWYSIVAEQSLEKYKHELNILKNELADFLMIHKESLKELRAIRRQTRALPAADVQAAADEIKALEDDEQALRLGIAATTKQMETTDSTLRAERKRPENSKEFGQPVRAQFDQILLDKGIDRSAMFGGDIDGNDCRRLMANAEEIVDTFCQFVLNHPSRIQGISNEIIEKVCEAHKLYLVSLDAYLSGMLTKRFHLTDDIMAKTEQYRSKCLEFERYLQMPITPKSHIIEAHSVQQQQRFHGIGDLDESFGERNHQVETRFDRRYGGIRDFAQREKMKAKEQAQSNHPEVEEKVAAIQKKRKRNYNSKKRDDEVEKQSKVQRRALARVEVLEFVIPPDTVLPRIMDERKRALKESDDD